MADKVECDVCGVSVSPKSLIRHKKRLHSKELNENQQRQLNSLLSRQNKAIFVPRSIPSTTPRSSLRNSRSRSPPTLRSSSQNLRPSSSIQRSPSPILGPSSPTRRSPSPRLSPMLRSPSPTVRSPPSQQQSTRTLNAQSRYYKAHNVKEARYYKNLFAESLEIATKHEYPEVTLNHIDFESSKWIRIGISCLTAIHLCFKLCGYYFSHNSPVVDISQVDDINLPYLKLITDFLREKIGYQGENVNISDAFIKFNNLNPNTKATLRDSFAFWGALFYHFSHQPIIKYVYKNISFVNRSNDMEE